MTERREFAAKLLLLAFVGLFVIFFSRPHGIKAPKVGEPAPAFTLQDPGAKAVSAADFKGKILVLNFWASWCGPCVEELPSLNKLAARYTGKDVHILGVSVDEDPDAYKEFLKKYSVAFQTVRNPSRSVSELYGTFKLPESYIVGRDGKILQKIIGATDWTSKQMLDYLDGLAAGA